MEDKTKETPTETKEITSANNPAPASAGVNPSTPSLEPVSSDKVEKVETPAGDNEIKASEEIKPEEVKTEPPAADFKVVSIEPTTPPTVPTPSPEQQQLFESIANSFLPTSEEAFAEMVNTPLPQTTPEPTAPETENPALNAADAAEILKTLKNLEPPNALPPATPPATAAPAKAGFNLWYVVLAIALILAAIAIAAIVLDNRTKKLAA